MINRENYARANDYLQLDAGSLWMLNNMVRHYLHTGEVEKAREIAAKVAKENLRNSFLNSCLNKVPAAELDQMAREHEAQLMANPDPENRFTGAPPFALCGKNDAALRLLKSGVEGKYCGYTSLQNDPLLAKLRGTPEFNEILAEAKKCREDFLAERAKSSQCATSIR